VFRLARRRHGHGDTARGDDNQAAQRRFGRAQHAQDRIAHRADEELRQRRPVGARRRAQRILVQPGHDEQDGDDAQKRLAVSPDRQIPIHIRSFAFVVAGQG
jgi:hypothetical protein